MEITPETPWYEQTENGEFGELQELFPEPMEIVDASAFDIPCMHMQQQTAYQQETVYETAYQQETVYETAYQPQIAYHTQSEYETAYQPQIGYHTQYTYQPFPHVHPAYQPSDNPHSHYAYQDIDYPHSQVGTMQPEMTIQSGYGLSPMQIDEPYNDTNTPQNDFQQAYPDYTNGSPNDGQAPGSSTQYGGSRSARRVQRRATYDNDELTRAYLKMRDQECHYCNIEFQSIPDLHKHIYISHRREAEASWEQPNLPAPLNLKLTRTVFEDAYTVYEADLSNVVPKDVAGLFLGLRETVFKKLRMRLNRHKVFKVQFELKLQMYRMEEDNVKHAWPCFQSFIFIVENNFYLQFAYHKTMDDFTVRVENYLEHGSGWILERINSFRILLSKMEPISGGNHFSLPYPLAHRNKTLINVPGNDGLCFKRAIIAHDQICGQFVKKKNKKRTLMGLEFYEKYGKTDKVNFDGIRFPFTIPQVARFERQNPHIALNILGFDMDREGIEKDDRVLEEAEEMVLNQEEDEEDIQVETEPRTVEERQKKKDIYDLLRDHTFPHSVCREQREITIDLLLVVNGTESHFCLITNLVGFLRNPSRKYITGICRCCLNSFSKKSYKKHLELCKKKKVQSTRFPDQHKFSFNKWSNMVFAPYILFADFESLLKKLQDPTKVHKHKASGYCWAFIDQNQELDSISTHIIEDEKENLLERLMAQLIALTDRLIKQMHQWEEEAYKRAEAAFVGIPIPDVDTECGFCHKIAHAGDIVRHHSHYPDFKFQFYSHRSCNLNAKVIKEVTCFVHNLKGYDSHFLIKALKLKNIVTDIEVVSNTAEKFPYIKINNKLVFKDSLSFFSSSLDGVANTLNPEDFKLSRKYFTEMLSNMFPGQNVDSKVELLLRKGVYPYSYFDCVEKYDETELPPPHEFYNDLTEKPIEPEEYLHAQRVWRELGIKNLREYTKIYVEADVLLLADCFQRMRKLFQEKFELDPIHYLSLPQLTWDCAMKFSGVELDYIRDENMHIWLEEAKRGGFSSVGDIRAAKANNKYMPDYDPSLPSTFICYHDINNLYPCSMTSYLPQKDFTWVEDDEFDELLGRGQEFIESIPAEGEYGYFFEVDLHFPVELHDKFNALPPAPYRRSVDYTELSPFQQYFADMLNVSETSLSNERLIADLNDRKKYKVHYRALQFYFSLGVRLEFIHSAIKFKQSPFFREYLLTLAEMRRNAKSKVEQNWLKLLSNSLFGKSCENKRNRSTCKLINCREKALKYNKKPNVSRVILLDKEDEDDVDIAIVCLKQTSAYLDRPLYIGVTTLDESKRIFYDYYYNVALKIWGKNDKQVRLAYTDTDSGIYVVETDDVFVDMYNNRHDHFDMSDFDKSHPVWGKFNDDTNKKRLGMMKDETANKVITHFCVAKSKMYTYRYLEDGVDKVSGEKSYLYKDVKKGKGIARSALDKQVNFEQYQVALEEPVQFYTTSFSIQSKNHEIYTLKQTKKGLSGFDLKRYIIPESIETLAYGHYSFKQHSPETNNLDNVITSVIKDEVEAEFSDTEY
ncbi:unnamed protein product [Orchesella dallaii]|uniref:DNA-directed DNA polymerase n=1 Tax=Orchesella dallaii TaxID=48710 RepID=A0ABP1S9S7_9HEXA